MTTKVRKQVYIEPDQEEMLKRLSQQTGISEAEIIRQAIDDHTRSARILRRSLRAWEDEREFILQRVARGLVSGQRTWRREDLHER